MSYLYKFNKNEVGTPIGFIRKDGKIKKDKVISIASPSESSKETDEIVLEGNQEFQLMPRQDKDRQVLFISGIQGSGKSYFIKNYIEAFRKIHKHQPIYFFSALDSDKTLETVEKEFKRVPIDESWIQEPLSLTEFEEVKKNFGGCLVIFDDVDSISNKKISDAVYTLLKNIVNVGRHMNISLIYTSHMPSDKNKTRDILNSSDCIVLFPASITRSTKYVLKEYFDIDDKELKELKKIRSRWLIITRNIPRMLFSEKIIKFLN